VGIGIASMQSAMTLYVKSIGFDQKDSGFLLSYVGLMAVLMNAVGLKFIKVTD
jgi:hypothetical protein